MTERHQLEFVPSLSPKTSCIPGLRTGKPKKTVKFVGTKNENEPKRNISLFPYSICLNTKKMYESLGAEQKIF